MDVVQWGIVSYLDAMALIDARVRARIAGQVDDVLYLVQHPATYSVGSGGSDIAAVTLTADEQAQGVEIHPTNRGGGVGYSDLGSLFGYFVLDTTGLGGGGQWLRKVARTLTDVLTSYGISATANLDLISQIGVWVGTHNIVGIAGRVENNIASQGFLLHVSTAVKPAYAFLCAPQQNITTMELELGQPVSMDDVRSQVEAAFQNWDVNEQFNEEQ